MLLKTKLLDVIACPVCKGRLYYDKHAQELVCNFDKLAYPIKNGVPVMLIESARLIKHENKKK